jgi:hypothetical protein
MQENNIEKRYFILLRGLDDQSIKDLEEAKKALSGKRTKGFEETKKALKKPIIIQGTGVIEETENETFRIVPENEVPVVMKERKTYSTAYDVTNVPEDQRIFLPGVTECIKLPNGRYEINMKLYQPKSSVAVKVKK